MQTTTVLKDYVLDHFCLRQNGGKNGPVGANDGEDREYWAVSKYEGNRGYVFKISGAERKAIHHYEISNYLRVCGNTVRNCYHSY